MVSSDNKGILMSPSPTFATSCHSSLPTANVYDIPVSDSIFLRLYSDTNPHNWKIADLQKGLIFVHNGLEKVGEGTGFGFPILGYADETYFPGTATIDGSQHGSCISVCKEFCMNMISRNNLKSVILENQKARALLRYLADLYQKHRHLRFLHAKNFFTNIGIKSSFVRTPPVGNVRISYIISKRLIHVKADFSLCNRKKPQKIFLLNEQSSKLFRRYSDANHTELFDKQIDAWEPVQADWACLTSIDKEFGFKMWRTEGFLRRGREFISNSMDWAGLDYEIDPRITSFEYDIEILEG